MSSLDTIDCVLQVGINPGFCVVEYGDLAGPLAHAWLMGGGDPYVVLVALALLWFL